ncbi:type II and III secretion system protein [Nostoc sp. NIES-3756]|uniref:type IV pilus secretin family protein n=1 Tax=Nostoc sp. NIES-3756 TaxID=1751286 RepID=UPI000720C2F6|nr:type IV pilus secretin family protein [Nostoc sp. NIES-3756]BAT55661.1 type II and III secretion system protein [Nostoc sp. NIES-3756]
MKHVHGNSLIFGAAACVFLAAQPVWAQTTQVTEVKVSPSDGGLSVVLKTSTGSRPQVFTTKRGKSLVADVINTQLRLRQGNNFRQDKPAPGIASIEVVQLDANSIRVIVTGDNDAPISQPVTRQQDSITLSVTPSSGTTASAPVIPRPPVSTTPPTSTTPSATTPAQTGAVPVLVPNPEVTIDGRPAQPAVPGQPLSQAPPFLPRAVAPPVGDIAISAIDASPTIIDLGTQERVPRLVLRDAPVREVLSLLARAANLNLAYIGGDAGKDAQAIQQTISLDIENEPVQDVFNYVLRLSGLEANRSNRTIFVGPKLPNSTRDVMMRSLRLNQVNVGVALNFLVALGAESAISRERLVTSVNAVPVGGAANTAVTQTQTTTETRVETQRVDFLDSKPLLRGLQVLGDERTNSVTLVGSQKLLDIAVSQLTQLDIRRRQVVVNVKIIDINLLGLQDSNASFSFGIGNNFFSSDGGAASFNFGGFNPPNANNVRNGLNPTVTANPYSGGNTFLDLTNPTPIPGTGIGNRVIDNGQLTQDTRGGAESFYNRRAGVSGDPFQGGFTDFTQGTPNVTSIKDTPAVAPIPAVLDGQGNVLVPAVPGTPAKREFTFEPGKLGTATAALPSLFQYPKRLLLSLQAQVQNGNAKILTDPTLIVQEGQQAVVKLTTEVFGGFENAQQSSSTGQNSQFTSTKKPIIKEAGLSLAVKVDRIDDNGFVSLSVSPTVSAPGGSTQTPDGEITLLSSRSLQSGLIRLRDGQTLILSGIIQESDRATVSKLPILGDLPLIGSLFRRSNKTNERREVIVLLTPQVMDDSQNSSYGYNYTPSPEVRQMLERRGLNTPRR